MNKYIFYTLEGQTTAPNEDFDIENCQVLGIVDGRNEYEAKETLLSENPWIIKAGFDSDSFLFRQILTREQCIDIKMLVNYLWVRKDDFFRNSNSVEDLQSNENSIFQCLKRLRQISS